MFVRTFMIPSPDKYLVFLSVPNIHAFLLHVQSWFEVAVYANSGVITELIEGLCIVISATSYNYFVK
jgi:hypothetical protein